MLSVFIIFISAFLVFLVQPMVAKMLLPYFGGGSAVWTGCLLFFQTLLLLGYGYAHGITKVSSLSRQKRLHGTVLMLALVNTWYWFGDQSLLQELHIAAQFPPLLTLLLSLFVSIGLPYFAVTTTGPLIQHWLANSNNKAAPYRLYALSNLGSLLALLSYPLLFEPNLSLSNQSTLWSLGFSLFVAVYLWYLAGLKGQVGHIKQAEQSGTSVARTDLLLWVLLSATGVIALVATSSAMTQNIPPMPFLWILPLVIYLLSFVITFNRSQWYVRWYWLGLFLFSALIGLFMFFIGSQFDIVTQVVMYSLILLSVCMICHGELEAAKPPKQHLTLFYLAMALGGFIGSAFVNFVAVALFTLYYEFLLSLLLTACLFIYCVVRDNKEQPQQKLMVITTALMSLLIVAVFIPLNAQYGASDIASSRNFYGILSVKDVQSQGVNERRLVDGSTSHGTQSLEQDQSSYPRSYYRYGTGVAKALEHRIRHQQRVGIIGLGAGTLAAYGKTGDDYIFYELNPDVERMATSYFTYLEASKANVAVVLGDARLSLEQALRTGMQQEFDVLVVDAFSGDSIPVHLLTEQALDLYQQHLSVQGIMAFHISNSHLNLAPVLTAYAKQKGLAALQFITPASERESHDVSWLLLTNDQTFINQQQNSKLATEEEQMAIWTDNYSDLISVLK